MPEARGVLLPAYVLVDESASMGPYVDELTAGLVSLCEELRTAPTLASKLRLAVLGFSDDVRAHLTVADMRVQASLPQVSARGRTDYGAAFADLTARIPTDVRYLRSEGYKVHRPVVFFLSDGQPTDSGWKRALLKLTDRRRTPAAPNIIACGMGSAERRTIAEVATRPEFGFVAPRGTDLGQAVSEFFQALTTSLIASSQALSSDEPTLVVTRPEGFTIALDEVMT
ncbi:vWA domain-containing protein [Catenulispora pinisilvae]|uniref:vWA domain-containing protein n=1 Tax=Catenulispora pinisilvae TaxID=2705253 RepID=UPI0018912362|nr:VWA domain-containing protein [Catenulispora pinisilvae]